MSKNLFRMFLSFFLAIALIAFVGAERGYAAPNETPTLSVTGSGNVTVIPDKANVTLGVSTHAKDAASAQNENARRAAAVQAAVKALGIDDKAIKTQNYSFRPTYEQNARHENQINGYTVDNSVVVTIEDLGKVGKVIDAALRAGANQVNSLTFAARSTDALKKVALIAAVNDAKNKAEIIAQGLNSRIVGVQHVSENVNMPTSRNYNAMFASAKMAAFEEDVATPVEIPELTMYASVQIDFILGN